MTRYVVLSLVVALMLALQATAPAAANPRFAAVVVDAKSGEIVFARNADEKRYPASLTKIMTLYLVFEDLKAGRIKLDTKMKVSAHAAGEPPSKIGFKVGQTVRVEDAIKILVTKSANDVAAVVGEALSGSVPAFAERMTRKARALGMTRTTFKNASGLPHSGQVTTARDMATLGLAIQRDFPEMYRNFSLRSYSYAGKAYRNHNGLLGKVSGMDGIKTGFIRASGFNLTASVERNHQRIVAVVMGGRTAASRNAYMAKLIEDMFRTASLTKTGAIAAFAGEPPGVDAAKLKLASLPPPLPRSKPGFAPEMAVQVAAAPVHTVGAEGSDEIAEAAADTISADAAAKASLAATIASIGEDIRAVEAAASNKSDAIMAAAEPASAPASPPVQETVLVKSGWTIQVGAFPSAEGAQTRLEQARKSGIDILSNKPGFTMAAQGSSGTIYRARFSGFTERHAREACDELSKKDVDCLALAP
ncbi:MAG TPA: D-alanyl-D-alanine carboxypeptidase [Aestuariivirgaceae bacterium]|nr:D-alanyl-D-alanine carboxypeptidase [Aestuariivirgaceae bacterium]